MRVAVVENMKVSHLGQVGVALKEADAEIEIFRAYAGEPLPEGPCGHDALVVLGGEQNALADETHPYLPELAALMRKFADADKAVLGICLGSQILARAYGAENRVGVTREFGWCPVTVTPEGAGDPLLSSLQTFPIFQWHDDTFTLPPGAVHLAANDTTTYQAFRIGRAAYGTQFHFEASRAVVEDWKERYPATIEGKLPGWLARHPDQAAAHGAEADAAGMAIARAWVGLIRTDKAA